MIYLNVKFELCQVTLEIQDKSVSPDGLNRK